MYAHGTFVMLRILFFLVYSFISHNFFTTLNELQKHTLWLLLTFFFLLPSKKYSFIRHIKIYLYANFPSFQNNKGRNFHRIFINELFRDLFVLKMFFFFIYKLIERDPRLNNNKKERLLSLKPYLFLFYSILSQFFLN